MRLYTHDSVLIIQNRNRVRGKKEIREAFIKIAKYLNNNSMSSQRKKVTIESSDGIILLSKKMFSRDNPNEIETNPEHLDIYFYNKIEGIWLERSEI